jgi:hypothetical protein
MPVSIIVGGVSITATFMYWGVSQKLLIVMGEAFITYTPALEKEILAVEPDVGKVTELAGSITVQ